MKKATAILVGVFLLVGCVAAPRKPPQRFAKATVPTERTDVESREARAISGTEQAAHPPAAGASPAVMPPLTVSPAPPEAPSGGMGQERGAWPPPPVVRVAAAESPPEATGENAPLEGLVQINFDEADLGEVVRTLAGLIGIKYVLDPDVKGTVTIHTAGGISREDLLPLFLQILEVNGLTAVKDGPLYRITAMKTASRLPIHFSGGGLSGDGIPFAERFMIQIIPLKHISATEMAKLLTPFASEGATIVAQESTNTLVVVDKVINIAKVLKMADAFDIGLFERVHHRFYMLQNASAKETAAMLREIFTTGAGSRGTLRFIPIERLNAVLALSADPRVFPRAEQFLMQLDAPGAGIEPRIFVYFVKNGGAEELSGLLNSVFDREKSGSTGKTARENPRYGFSRNPFAERPVKPIITEEVATPAQAEPANPSEETSSAPKGDVLIIPDPVRNALIIEATPSDYKMIEGILTRIDVLPRQVLIEAMIAEISLDDEFKLGVEWEYTRERDSHETGLLNGLVNGDGLTYAVAFSRDLLHNLNALASKNKVNILSSPHVLASDGKEARIDVSDEIPIVSSETVVTSGAEPLVTTDIQYRDTGVLLAVTPHINENGLVTMEVYQEVSELGDDVNVAGENYPSFFKRSVDTTLTVGHNQTIVLGGLIRENKGQGRSGVPGLIEIPGLGWLFGDRNASYDKAELIILLTPKVITNLDDVTAVTEEFEHKVGQAVRYLQEKQEVGYVKP